MPMVAVMPYTPFYDVFPDVAKAETRCLFVFEDAALPSDQYALTELYCNESDCDCRRVFLQVYAEARKEFVAVVAFGWESIAFYRKWLHDDDPMALSDLKGPVLNRGSPQCEISAVVLDHVKAVLRDQAYVDRLKRHYRLFKGTLKGAPIGTTAERANTTNQTGRNQPCPCGSGLKYKYCCGR